MNNHQQLNSGKTDVLLDHSSCSHTDESKVKVHPDSQNISETIVTCDIPVFAGGSQGCKFSVWVSRQLHRDSLFYSHCRMQLVSCLKAITLCSPCSSVSLLPFVSLTVFFLRPWIDSLAAIQLL